MNEWLTFVMVFSVYNILLVSMFFTKTHNPHFANGDLVLDSQSNHENMHVIC